MKKDTFTVTVKNHVTKKWEVMKLRYDPRTGGEGVAVYNTKQEAQFDKNMALALIGGSMDIRIRKNFKPQ